MPLRNSLQDAIVLSDLIIVGVLASASCAPDPSAPRRPEMPPASACQADIEVVRVVKGLAHLAGRRLPIRWEFQPFSGEVTDLTPTSEAHHALWFLKSQPAGSNYDAMWAGLHQQPAGGYLVPLPEGGPVSTPANGPGSSYQRRLAAEIAGALQLFAQQNPASLIWPKPQAVDGANRSAWFSRNGDRFGGDSFLLSASPSQRLRRQFATLSALYRELEPAAIQDMSQYLLTRPELPLKVAGLLGRLRGRDPTALMGMEPLYSDLPASPDSYALINSAAEIDLSGQPAALSAVGRMLLSETANLSLETNAPYQLGHAKSVAALNYLVPMLLHPQMSIRSQAAKAVCAVFESEAILRPLADVGLSGACDIGTVAANRIGRHTSQFREGALPRVDIAVLRDWLNEHALTLQSITGSAAMPPPQRYRKGNFEPDPVQ